MFDQVFMSLQIHDKIRIKTIKKVREHKSKRTQEAIIIPIFYRNYRSVGKENRSLFIEHGNWSTHAAVLQINGRP